MCLRSQHGQRLMRREKQKETSTKGSENEAKKKAKREKKGKAGQKPNGTCTCGTNSRHGRLSSGRSSRSSTKVLTTSSYVPYRTRTSHISRRLGLHSSSIEGKLLQFPSVGRLGIAATFERVKWLVVPAKCISWEPYHKPATDPSTRPRLPFLPIPGASYILPHCGNDKVAGCTA